MALRGGSMYPGPLNGKRILLRISETEAIDPDTGEHFHLSRKQMADFRAVFWVFVLLGFLFVLLFG